MSYGLITELLMKYVPHKQLGWKEINEDFIRFQLVKSPFLNIYLHRLDAEIEHPNCHDHPWHFWALILWNGYREYIKGKWYWRGPMSILYRPALSLHNVVTKSGQPSWSIIVTSGKNRDWGFKPCYIQ